MIKYYFLSYYRKYGFLGSVLLLAAVSSITLGIFITYKFLITISDSLRTISPGEKIETAETSMVSDFFGGVVGTIWSFAGVILFFLALRLQSKELGLQIQELKNTREVFSIQQFENTFFNLLKTQNDIKLSVELTERKLISLREGMGENLYRSNQVFDFIKSKLFENYNHFKQNIEVYNSKKDSPDFETYKSQLQSYFDFEDFEDLEDEFGITKIAYSKTFKEYHNQLSHYFRNLYHILRYVKENEDRELGMLSHDYFTGSQISIRINNNDIGYEQVKKKYRRYSDFIQAQMSGSELFLLFYNALFFPKMENLVQYYELVKNLSIDDMLNSSHTDFYCEYVYKLEKIPAITFKSRKEILGN
ncbi:MULTISPECIES: putative phage abortive infection protein [unclassified Flavobacterium]|uniref:putative phage abortive infection protein n=1 Tax=unclassified Flavobacterium TaxID=196869 RepID=UPI001F143127|nr:MULTISPECIES: putative phage abortive infection protein [unclassified Flavobacterium]UMY64921.1 putative phage abortive infection protein [Flavobacterium sp. HJ-32-4]